MLEVLNASVKLAFFVSCKEDERAPFEFTFVSYCRRCKVNQQSVALKKVQIFEMTDAKARLDCMKEINLLQVRSPESIDCIVFIDLSVMSERHSSINGSSPMIKLLHIG